MKDLAPSLAVALGNLRRSPGTGSLAWVDDVLRRFERARRDDYNRLRRVHGLARKLGALGRLGDEESAEITVGLFVHVLIGDPPIDHGGKAPRAWLLYLRREDWVERCLEISRLVRLPEWEHNDDSLAAVLARAVWIFDAETIVEKSRTVSVLRSLRAHAGAPGMARVVELFWSEKGQEICHTHVLRRWQSYALKPAEIKNSIKLLREELQRAAPPLPAPSRRVLMTPEEAPAPNFEAAAALVASESLEKRKRSFKAAPNLREAFTGGAAHAGDADARQLPEEMAKKEGATPAPPAAAPRPERVGAESGDAKVARAAEAPRRLEEDRPGEPVAPVAETETDVGPRQTRSGQDTLPGGVEPGQEEAKMDARSRFATGTHAGDDLDVGESLEELKSRLVQIEQLAGEARELLAALGPSIQEFSSMLAQFDSMLSRWKGHDQDAKARDVA